MEIPTRPLPTETVLAAIRDALDASQASRCDLTPEARLRLATSARALTTRLDALASVLLAEADAANASLQTVGTPTSSWLAIEQNLTRRESAGLLHRAGELAKLPRLAAAAAEGRVSAGQVRTISNVLGGFAGHLDATQKCQAEESLVALAATLDADALAKAAPQVLAQVAPADAGRVLETRLQREAEAAHRGRSLRFWRQAGSVRFEGSLPKLAGEQFITLLDTHTEALRRTAVEARDPLHTGDTPEQRRADALTSLLQHAAQVRPAKGAGVGTARVIVKLDYHQLQAAAQAAGIDQANNHDQSAGVGAAGAGTVGDGTLLSAGELRRACCDAEIIPVVLGGPSEVLDVGRARRLVTPAIRTALIVRDQGCVFPGCTASPTTSEAHHIRPWWDGGLTRLSNLVLLCHHHHGLIEPAKYGLRDQWRVRIGQDHLPEFAPPTRHPQTGTWLHHARHRTVERTAA